ncbi:hydantoinase/oxoprolinase family protein [Rhodococcus sp. IC4_135]|uniref:hydantoinase/oxoprolinase family protein n=1 Tax=Rhodococcus sp. IC4_135 TaxID=2715537 RepID=UPI00141E02BD|nr:hydantoinase/oxoprolinase family protein [Rhodococcus sp. IC4_135]
MNNLRSLVSDGAISVSADVGGTFTDVVRVDVETGDVVVGKSPTVHHAPAEGIIAALSQTDADLTRAVRFLHGTTVGINALLEHKGARVGFLTTAGFADMLEIRRGSWPPYQLSWDKPKALVGRELCREIDERIAADGSIVKPLNVSSAVAAVDALVADGIEALAVCLVNAYIEPKHERQIVDLVQTKYPDMPVVVSHEITRRYREYERAVTTVSEAYIRPKMTEYFSGLADGLASAGFGGELYITSSDGGVMGLERAQRQTLRTLVSGCASGIAGAASLGVSCGYKNLICIDMGGTSFDAGIVRHGVAEMSNESEIAGLTLLLPMIELATIGAGGGSIAWVDELGGLNVGPESAGSTPGPASYGRGGIRPTFSDAALVSGLLPDSLLDGAMKLSTQLATDAVVSEVATPLSMDAREAASGVVTLIEARMARLLEEITIGKGHDPRDFDLLAYGGGGPLVASTLGDLLGITRVVVPRHPGVFSAWGMQTLDVAHEFSRSEVRVLRSTESIGAANTFAELLVEAHERLESEGIQEDRRAVMRFVELRYDGQEHTLAVPVLADDESSDTLRERFESMHEDAYGFRLVGDLEIVGYRVRALGSLPKPDVPEAAAEGSLPTPISHRQVTHRASDTTAESWPVYRRESLGPGVEVAGPAIIEELTTTTVVTPQRVVHVDAWGNLILEARP